MGRKNLKEGEVSKSQSIRDLLKVKPSISAKDAVAALAEKGIKIKLGLFYLVKGNVAGRKGRRKKNKQKAVTMMTASTNGDAMTTLPAKGKSDALGMIRKIKGLAAEVGGLRSLAELVEVLRD